MMTDVEKEAALRVVTACIQSDQEFMFEQSTPAYTFKASYVKHNDDL